VEIDTDAVHESGDDQGDLLPGAPLLDRSLGGMDSKLLVRAEYIRVFKLVEQIYNERKCDSSRRPPAVVITGSQGSVTTIYLCATRIHHDVCRKNHVDPLSGPPLCRGEASRHIVPKSTVLSAFRIGGSYYRARIPNSRARAHVMHN
jgi:hypothetical protein